MNKVIKSFQNNGNNVVHEDVTKEILKNNEISAVVRNEIKNDKNNLRHCPSCGLLSLQGMPGGRDATCLNCGYKDPCCYD